jgi:hypothetical protein
MVKGYSEEKQTSGFSSFKSNYSQEKMQFASLLLFKLNPSKLKLKSIVLITENRLMVLTINRN